MSSANVLDNIHRCLATNGQVIADPGASGTFNLADCPYGGVATIASGTRKLPDNMPLGTIFDVYATGAVTITNAAGTTVKVLASGEVGRFEAITTTAWVGQILTTGAAAGGSQTMAADKVSFTSSSTDASDVNGALSVLLSALTGSPVVWAGAPLSSFREVDSSGDVGNAAANGGVLDSATTPIYLGDAVEAQAIQWASSNSDIIACQVTLPPNFDGTQNATIELLVQSAGTADAPSFTVLTNWNGGAQVTDTAAGTAVSTKQTITATIAAADITGAPMSLSLQLVPGTHATDAWTLYGVRVKGGGADLNV